MSELCNSGIFMYDITLKLLVDWLLPQFGQIWVPYLVFMNKEASVGMVSGN